MVEIGPRPREDSPAIKRASSSGTNFNPDSFVIPEDKIVCHVGSSATESSSTHHSSQKHATITTRRDSATTSLLR